MNELQPDPASAAKLVQELIEALAPHDSATQQRAMKAAATLLLHPASETVNHEMPSRMGSEPHAGLAEFFDRGEKLKPADYAQLCAAYHYARHGAIPFSLDEIRAIGAEAGIVLPDRLDKTFKAAAHHGKKLFQTAGRAVFKPTATAGLAFGERWGVKPGRAAKSEHSQEPQTVA